MRKWSFLFIILIFFSLNLAGQTENEDLPGTTEEQEKYMNYTNGWVNRIGGDAADRGRSVSVDNEGNVYVLGVFQGEFKFGPNMLKSKGGEDIILVKYNPAGEVIWVNHMEGAGNNWANDMTIAGPAGNIYVTGNFIGSLDFGGASLTTKGGIDAFVAKYSADGELIWIKQFGGRGNDQGREITTDDKENVYVAGVFNGEINIGNNDLITSRGANDAFFVKYDINGNRKWIKHLPGDQDIRVIGSEADAKGNLYLVGKFEQNIVIGDSKHKSTGDYDIFIVKYDPQGQLVWSKRDGGELDDAANAIALTQSGELFITGSFESSTIFGEKRLSSVKGSDIFIVKYKPNGRVDWVRQARGSAGDDLVNDIAVDAIGNVYIGGNYHQLLAFSEVSIQSAGIDDVFLAKFSPDSRLEWVARAGSLGNDEANGVAVGIDGHVYLTGAFSYTANFGKIEQQAQGSSDIFIWQVE